MCFIVIHKRDRSYRGQPWFTEDKFRYWRDRRAVLGQRKELLVETITMTDTIYVRMEIWASKEAFETFRDDICARVIESVVKHEQSLHGTVHETYFGHPER